MPYGGSGANKAPMGPLNPILLGQKKEGVGQSLLSQHLNKRRDEGTNSRPGQGTGDNQQSNYGQGNFSQQTSYNQQGNFGAYNQQQSGFNQQHGGYNQQQGTYNQQRGNQQNFDDSNLRTSYDNRNQQPKPLMSLTSQPPYNQYSNAPPPPPSNQGSYGTSGSNFPMPPTSFNAPPPNVGNVLPHNYPPPGFGNPPPPPAPQNSAYAQPPAYGGPPLPPSGPSQPPQPPLPSTGIDYENQPPVPSDYSERQGRSPTRGSPARKRKRRSRWGDEQEKTQIPGMPASLPVDATQDQREEYLLHFKIEEISIKLRSGDLGIPENPEDRSPSPEPIYNTEGKRLNTREYRVRKRLEEERHSLIEKATLKNPDYKPPIDYRPPSNRIQEKVMIPQDANPAINFIGLLIGPRGNTLKKMEKDTNCKIIIRGKGSVKEGKGRPGFPLPGENEPLHALVTGPSQEDVKNAVKIIEKIIKEGVETPEGSNELRKMQLRELAALNGTLIEEDIQRCRNCGATDHRHWECTEVKNVTSQVVCTKCGGMGHIANDCVFKTESGTTPQPSIVEKAKMDDEYMSLMAELGVDAPPSKPPVTQTSKPDITPSLTPVAEANNTPAKSQNQTSSAPWTADPKPLMSAATPYSQRPPQPKPLMPPSGPLSGTQRGPLAGPPGGGAPWSAPPTYDQNQRTNVQRGQLPPWSQVPPPPWQQPPVGPYNPPVGYNAPPPYPPMGQTPPIPPWSAPPPPPPPPSK